MCIGPGLAGSEGERSLCVYTRGFATWWRPCFSSIVAEKSATWTSNIFVNQREREREWRKEINHSSSENDIVSWTSCWDDVDDVRDALQQQHYYILTIWWCYSTRAQAPSTHKGVSQWDMMNNNVDSPRNGIAPERMRYRKRGYKAGSNKKVSVHWISHLKFCSSLLTFVFFHKIESHTNLGPILINFTPFGKCFYQSLQVNGQA